MPRPRKTRTINIRLDEDSYQTLKEAARAATPGEKIRPQISEYIRGAVQMRLSKGV